MVRVHILLASIVIGISSEMPTLAEEKDSESAKAIRKVLDDQVVCWNKGDLKGFMDGYWNSKELSFYSGNKKTLGWQETLERYQKKYQGEGNEMGQLKFSELEIQLLGEKNAVVKGRWELTLSKDKEKPNGLFTLIVQKTDSGWKIIHDHTSN
jgi:ketosteroid isomerase-like protein